MTTPRKLLIFLKNIVLEFLRFNKGIFEAIREQSVETLEQEYLELENAFLSMVIGGIVGIPLVPSGISMELLPLVKEEIIIMEKRAFLGADTLADFFSTLGGEW